MGREFIRGKTNKNMIGVVLTINREKTKIGTSRSSKSKWKSRIKEKSNLVRKKIDNMGLVSLNCFIKIS